MFSRRALISFSAVSFFIVKAWRSASVSAVSRLRWFRFFIFLVSWSFSCCLSVPSGDHPSKYTINYVLENRENAPKSVVLAAISYRIYRAPIVYHLWASGGSACRLAFAQRSIWRGGRYPNRQSAPREARTPARYEWGPAGFFIILKTTSTCVRGRGPSVLYTLPSMWGYRNLPLHRPSSWNRVAAGRTSVDAISVFLLSRRRLVTAQFSECVANRLLLNERRYAVKIAKLA